MTIVTWNGGTGSWYVADNWTPHTSPVAGDMVFITSGTPTIDGVKPIGGETITLGGTGGGSTVTLQATSATFEQDTVIVTGGGPSGTVNATLLSYGATVFHGRISVEALGGSLTIDAESDNGSADFTLSNGSAG